MYRFFVFMILLFFPVVCFSQENLVFNIIGQISSPENSKIYQIQVGAFKDIQNAERAFAMLSSASLDPVYDRYLDFIRVIVKGITSNNVAACMDTIRILGFGEVWIKEDSLILPTSTAALPARTLTEIGFRTIKVGETENIADLAGDTNIVQWTSSTPSSFSVNSNGDVMGISIGNGFVTINENEYISIAVVPSESFYVVPESQAALLPPDSRTGNNSSTGLTEYRTEPTFRLAYRFNNKGENRGASGRNGGIDILARGENYEWLWTTYEQGGWFYDLNGIKREMVNGYQKDVQTGIELTVKPEFVYDSGVPYLQPRIFF